MIVRFIVLTSLFIFSKTVLLYVNHLFPDSAVLLPAYYVGDLIFAALFSLPGKKMRKAAVFACAVVSILYAVNTAFFSYLHDWIRFSDLLILRDIKTLLSSAADPELIRAYLYSALIGVAGFISFTFLKRTVKEDESGLSPAMLVFIVVLCVAGSIAVSQSKPIYNNPMIALVLPRDSVIKLKPGLSEDVTGILKSESADESASSKNKSFNVIIISMESVGSVSRYESKESVMPYFEKLAEEGVYCENGYAPYPLTMKSLFSVFTGRYPSADQRVIGELNPDIKIQTLSEYFHKTEYRTALIHGSYFRYQLKSEFFKKRGFDVMIDADELKDEYALMNSWGVGDTAVYEKALDWIAAGKQPFFLTLLPLFAHHPYDSPENGDSNVRFEPMIERYQKALRHRDEELKYFIESLRSRSLLSDTLIVIFGDHGEAFTQHDRNIGHTGFLYEENVRV
ncbi:MAG: LTA synthase family protein, partial [Candidatus Omnitrophica bacterium]|nr:LTA synthase family protein [Candidatus Omnitrophota bacterium]